jgi:quercetin dioxygenase-like cupin family protein
VAKPFVVFPENRSRALNVVGEKITVLASKEDTHGYEVFFQDGIEGTGPPPHSHDWDESFFVLEGDIQFGFDGREMVATPGTLVHVPAGTEHWFRFESDEGQMLSVTGAGSGAAAFFNQVDADVSDGADIEGLTVVAEKHRLRIAAPGSQGDGDAGA